MKIKLSKNELTYLSGAGFLLPHQLELLVNAQTVDAGVVLTVTQDAAEEFRTLFTEQLAKIGFDESYEPTSEGKLLEELIDKFFVV